jgi:hypothetical protein
MGYALAQLVEVLRYKPEGRGVDSRRCHWNSSLTLSICTMALRNEYQEYFLMDKGGRFVWLTTLPFSSADCLEI